jgi:hypothetical protein
VQDVIQTPDTAFLIMLAGAISLQSMALRHDGALAAAAFGLGVAALPGGAHPVTVALMVLGMVGAAVTAVRARRTGILLGLGSAAAGWSARGLFAAVEPGPLLIATVVIMGIAALGLRTVRLLRTRSLLVPVEMPYPVRPAPAAVLCLCVALVAFGPQLGLVFLGAAGASWTAWLLMRGSSPTRWPVVPAAVTAVLLFGWYFMATIAGPVGLSMRSLSDLPLSPAAEIVAAAVLLLASWLLTGLWPLHRRSPAPFVAPAAALLLIRVALVAMPAGMEHWRPLAAPLAMLGIAHAAFTRRAAGLAVGGAWMALVSVQPSAVGAAAWLIPCALLLGLLGAARDGESSLRRWGRRVVWLAAGWGGLLALEASLGGEVVYSVLAAASAALGMSAGDQAMTPSAPSSTAPRA